MTPLIGEFFEQEEVLNSKDIASSFYLKGNGLKIWISYRKKIDNNFIYNIQIDNRYYNSTTKIKVNQPYHEYIDCMYECGEMEEMYYAIILADRDKLQKQILGLEKSLNEYHKGKWSDFIDKTNINMYVNHQKNNIESLDFLNKIQLKLKYPEEQIIYF